MIPSVFYLTHKEYTKNVEEKIYLLKKVYPNFIIKFFNNKECRKWLVKNYGKRYVDIFNNFKSGPHKADFFRYCILYKNGGYYLDTDNVMLKNIEDFVNNYDLVSFIKSEPNTKCYKNDTKYHHKHIHQGFIACKPNMPILLELINQMIKTPVPKIIDKGMICSYHCYVRYFYIFMVESLDVDEIKVNKSYVWNNKYKVCFLEQDWIKSDIMTNEKYKNRFNHLK